MAPKRRGEVKGQLRLDWAIGAGEAVHAASPLPAPSTPAPAIPPAVLSLPWDFKTSFPQPTPQAIDAGVIADEDADPQNIRSIHDEHARQGLAVLHDLDLVLDARRRGIDPKTGRAPTTHTGRERLRQTLEHEPARLERWFSTLMGTYEEVFGADASNAFEKAIRAWHEGMDVVAEKAGTGSPRMPNESPEPSRVKQPLRKATARLPVPRPLPQAIAEGRFGFEEDGRAVRPGRTEVRAITQQHADLLIDLMSSDSPDREATGLRAELVQSQIADALDKYAEDFGIHAATQLKAYVGRQVRLADRPPSPNPRRR